MIRPVNPLNDAEAISLIYNFYVENSDVTFETVPVSVHDMAYRISDISSKFPYFVFERDGSIVGFCFAHLWKARDAYNLSLETSVYVDRRFIGNGIGKALMEHLIAECRLNGYKALIACITGGNVHSCALHRTLGFSQVSLFKSVGWKFGKWLDVVDFELILS